jgi:hypothetical protein
MTSLYRQRAVLAMLAAPLAAVAMLGPPANAAATAALAAPGVHSVTAAPASAPNPDRVAVPARYIRTKIRVAGTDRETTATIPIYYITSTNYGFLTGIHACKALGNDGTNQGVVCADVFAYPPSASLGGVAVFPFLESYCQNLADHNDYPACNEKVIPFTLANGAGQVISATTVDACGPYAGTDTPCPSGRQLTGGAHGFLISGCDPEPGTIYEMWSVEYGIGLIHLPTTNKPVGGTASNLASPHAIVCEG